MRVLHVAEIIRGGVGAVLRLNMLAQREALGESNVRALVPADQAEDLHPVPAASLATFERSGRNFRSIRALRSVLAREVADYDPDIVHLHSAFAGTIGRLPLFAGKQRFEIVYTPHAWPFLMEGSRLRKMGFAQVERILSRRTMRIICVSNFERDQALAYGLPAGNLEVIHNGVPDRGPPRRDRRAGDPMLRLLFVGRLTKQKGFDLLQAAMDRLRDLPVKLSVAGAPVKPGAKPEPRPNIEHLGWLGHDAVIARMRQADALVMPSRWEAFAMVPLEAMSCGLPVIASDIGPLREIVADGETGLVFRNNDVDDLAATLRGIERSRLAALGQRSYDVVTTRYSARKMCFETIGIYGKVMTVGRQECSAACR